MNYKTINTAAIHGAGAANSENAHITPIYATSTFVFDNADQGMNRFTGKENGYIYSRFGNPTTHVAEELIAKLETFGLNDSIQLKAYLHASGQAAMTTLFMSNLVAGDTVLASHTLYGGTYEFLSHVITQLSIRSVFADLRDLNKVEDILKNDKSIKLIHIETPSNPTMHCVDIEAVCRVAKKYNVKVSVDNTVASPYLQQPFKYGADFVYHSTTKFLNGHGTALGGILLGKDIDFMNKNVFKIYKLFGGNSNAFDAFLLIQGIKTLPVRMDRHCSNAMAVAKYLSEHKAISKVHFNGLPSHSDYKISAKQMSQHGALLSFELKDGFNAAKKFVDNVKVCVLAVSLGTVDTLVSHPASMSHLNVSKEDRLAAGVTDGLIRMSVGLEGIDDILNDLEQALS